MTSIEELLNFEAAERDVHLDVNALVRRGHQRRRQRAALASAIAVAFVAVAGVALARPSHPHPVIGAGRATIPCDRPTRAVPRYLDWPCAPGRVNPYFQAQAAKLVTQARISTIYRPGSGSFPDAPDAKVQIRVLAFGAQPNSTPGTTFMIAEYWRTAGTSPAQIEVLHTAPDGSASTDRSFMPVTGDPPIISIVANLQRFTVGTYHFLYPHLTLCHQLSQHPPVLPADTAVSCARTVVVRPDVTTVRLTRGPGHRGPLVHVVHQVAALPEAKHDLTRLYKTWRIEAFNSSGKLLGAVAYDTAIFPTE